MFAFIAKHWPMILLVWFGVSCLVSPLIGKFLGGLTTETPNG